MKRTIALFALLCLLTACGQQTAPQEAPDVPGAELEGPVQPPVSPPEDGVPEDGELARNSSENGALVVYFSATGSTKRVAGFIAEALGADIYEIVPAEPYTSDDLNWRDGSSRVSVEHENPDLRPALDGELPELDGYDTIFLGYPLWWRQAPHVVRTFLESVDLSGKTVIPFCTSSSSELGDSAENLHSLAPDAVWQEGIRFPSQAEETEAAAWVGTLELAG